MPFSGQQETGYIFTGNPENRPTFVPVKSSKYEKD
jgi:hypothetical protein